MKFKSFNEERLVQARLEMARLKEEITELVRIVRIEKQVEKDAKQFAREQKKAQQIAKLEERIAKMKNPKRPSKVKVFTGAEAQQMIA